jgi:hypothetical protein
MTQVAGEPRPAAMDAAEGTAALSITDLSFSNAVTLHNLSLELVSALCLHLDPRALVRFAAVCRRFSYGDGAVTSESPVVPALRKHACPGSELIPSMQPAGCSESCVAYLARCARQRRCQDAPPLAVGDSHSLYLDAAGRLLAFGKGASAGQDGENAVFASSSMVSSGFACGASPRAVRTASPSAGMAGSFRGATEAVGSWATEIPPAPAWLRRQW